MQKEWKPGLAFLASYVQRPISGHRRDTDLKSAEPATDPLKIQKVLSCFVHFLELERGTGVFCSDVFMRFHVELYIFLSKFSTGSYKRGG